MFRGIILSKLLEEHQSLQSSAVFGGGVWTMGGKGISDFFSSEIFIGPVVVLVFLILAGSVFYCIRRRRRAQKRLTQRLSEIVVVRAEGENQDGPTQVHI
ncbi:hypothetical protein SKAU_G00041950 [Synaphobranchus kaupii]|uniref:Uncharacterized protein n=1 Tax=Synaphobranchus kaupii TaxID=118154 RepID=A0A9Q1G1G4_SYNKA|nr:hypothetical protein SKAU_G00041950 [Synaphobranchus kaupii]